MWKNSSLALAGRGSQTDTSHPSCLANITTGCASIPPPATSKWGVGVTEEVTLGVIVGVTVEVGVGVGVDNQFEEFLTLVYQGIFGVI